MRDPNRILEGDAADPVSQLERGLLSSLDHPERDQRRVWQRLSVQLGLAASAGALSQSAAAASAGKWLGLSAPAKVIVALAVTAPMAGGIAYWVEHERGHEGSVEVAPPRAPTPPKQTPRAVSAQPSPRVVEEAASPPEPSAEPTRRTAQRSPALPSEPAALVEENRRLREARALARSGEAQRALGLLHELDVRFPRGALLQEREVLRIQALEQSGSTDQAAARARAFLRRYPQSPYAQSLKRIAGLL